MTHPRRPVDDALDAMMHVFWQLDQVQREAARLVHDYRLYLPQRAASSGLVPRHQHLDAQADALVAEYLDVLDRFPVEDQMRPHAQQQAMHAFNHVGPRLEGLARELERLMEQYAPELRAVGEEREKGERRKQQATAALERAHQAWNRLREEGFEFRTVDEALARARIAGRALAGWTPDQGAASLGRAAEAVEQVSEQVVTLAAELPDKVRRLRRRTPSLRTRLEAVGTRSLKLADAMTALRKEFSVGNWRDLEDQQELVDRLVVEARKPLARLEKAVADEDWDVALSELAEVERALVEADRAVDAPQSRLATLRELKDDPEPAFRKARFTLRDAQMLVTQTRPDAATVRELDALAARLDHARSGLQGVHPDYWSVLTELQRIQESVGRVVERYRGRR